MFDEIVLALELMNEIESIDEYSGILECEAGCVLGKLEEKLDEKGMIMPLDLGSKNSCQIGGNLATNAGGIRLMRHGNLHGSVLGLEAVKADGTVLDLMSHFKKDNTGYHLKHMFIGSEGTLGVITRVAIACPTAPTAQNVMFLGVENYGLVLHTFLKCKERLGEILTSCELIDSDAFDCCIQHLKRPSPIGEFPFYMLIETTGSNAGHDEEKVQEFLEHALSTGTVGDGVVTNEPSKMEVSEHYCWIIFLGFARNTYFQDLWQLRERIPEGTFSNNFCLTYDLSLPLGNFYDIVPVMKQRVGHLVKLVCGFGHIGNVTFLYDHTLLLWKDKLACLS